MGGKLTPEQTRFHAYKVNVYDVTQKKHVMMSLEESIIDVMENHDCMDYGVTKEFFEENKKLVLNTFKALDYRPVLTRVNGKYEHEPINGAYFFRYQKNG